MNNKYSYESYGLNKCCFSSVKNVPEIALKCHRGCILCNLNQIKIILSSWPLLNVHPQPGVSKVVGTVQKASA